MGLGRTQKHDSGRRAFLLGRFNSQQNAVQLPPWAVDPQKFMSLCDGCGDCEKVCPSDIIAISAEGFAKVEFTQGECTFCGDCVASCTRGALRDTSSAPWQIKAHIGSTCLAWQNIACRSCGELCATDAISFHPVLGHGFLPQVDSYHCNGCGACYRVCPTHAISFQPQNRSE